jgi:hypothetical protein
VWTAFFENATLAELLYEILTIAKIDTFQCFADAVNGGPPDFSHASIAEVSSLAAQFGLVGLLRQMEAHDSMSSLT